MSRGLIVYDSDHPLCAGNRCFDPAERETGIGHGLLIDLATQARRRDFEIETSDVFLRRTTSPANVVCITDMVSKRTDAVLATGARPLISLSQESPLVAWRYYHRIRELSGRFVHSYQFAGTQERLRKTPTVFHPMHYPMDTRVLNTPRPWRARRFAVMVNSNKRALAGRGVGMRSRARAAAATALRALWSVSDPWMRLEELYLDRVEAIRFFADNGDFQLFGFGWERPIAGFDAAYAAAARRVYGGALPPGQQEKRAVMGRFRFALCFENCAFPGYVTEKVFDCFLAGCIPVYYGAPDIGDFVPLDAIVDFRRFDSFAALNDHLLAMTEGEARRHLDAAAEFLQSPRYSMFLEETLVREWLDLADASIGSGGRHSVADQQSIG